MIDLKNIRQIANGDEAFVRGILEVFLSKEDEYKQSLQADWDRGDYQALRQSIHKLKSSISVLGMKPYRQRLNVIEVAIEEGIYTPEQIYSGLQESLEIFEKALQEVRDSLDKL